MINELAGTDMGNSIKKEVVLSDRLKSLANMVTRGNRICDVGCDHGYLSIYLIQNKISPSAIAMDVRTGPLSRCEEHVKEYGLEAYIETRLSDGLDKLLPGEADAMVCAGMGGRLMMKILTKGYPLIKEFRELILQPQSEIKSFREFLRKEGFRIMSENMVEEDGKFYPMMKVVYDDMKKMPAKETSRIEDRFGELLLKDQNPVLYRFLQYRKEVLLNIKESMSGSINALGPRSIEVEGELQDIEEAFTYYK